MIRLLLTILTLSTFLVINLNAQNQLRTSQFFLNAPAVNPAFTGVDDYWELRTGFRQQWAGLDNSPSTIYAGIYGVIKKPDALSFQENSLRISTPSLYASEERKKGLRHGVGATVFLDDQVALEQLSAMVNYALHLSISRELNLTLGTSFGYFSREVNPEELTVKQIADQTYQNLIDMGGRQSFLDVNLGLLLYSEKFYAGVAAMPIVHSALANSDAIEEDDNQINYSLMGGYQFNLNPEWRLQSSGILRYDEINEINYELGIKFRKYDIFWTGLAYNSREYVSILFGAMIKDRLILGYSYDYNYSDQRDIARGNHEVLVGFALFKNRRSKPYAW